MGTKLWEHSTSASPRTSAECTCPPMRMPCAADPAALGPAVYLEMLVLGFYGAADLMILALKKLGEVVASTTWVMTVDQFTRSSLDSITTS